MNSAARELLEQHFDIAFAAPGGIKKLRELILTLAMQGKLVPQDPSDPPASQLLKEIEAEKSRLWRDGKIKAPKSVPEVKLGEVPYDLPRGWIWSTLAQVALINPRNNAADSAEVSFVPMTLIGTGNDGAHEQEVRAWADVKQGFTHFAEGDIGVAKITPCFENSKACVFSKLKSGLGAGTTELHIVRPVAETISPRYVLAYLKSPQFLLVGQTKMTGTAGQKRLPKEFVESNPFPLPPLPEQHRIVAKIDQLMTRCDELEILRAEREQKRRSVHAAALRQLLDSQAADSIADAWQFISHHFGDLYAVKENVTELRKAILQLAVMGKLVPQHANDPPASQLLKEIEAEKKRLVKEGKIKAPKPLSAIKQGEVPYAVPQGWEWVRFGAIAFQITDGAHHTPTYVDQGIPFLSVKDMSSGRLDFSETRFISKAQHEELIKRCRPQRGDLLLTKVGTTGIPVLIETDQEFSIFVSVSLIKFDHNKISGQYLSLLVKSPLVKKQSEDGTEGVGNKNLVLRKISGFVLPLPPLPEQHRIVAKIDRLMALCDGLEQQIDAGTVKQTELLNALMAPG